VVLQTVGCCKVTCNGFVQHTRGKCLEVNGRSFWTCVTVRPNLVIQRKLLICIASKTGEATGFETKWLQGAESFLRSWQSATQEIPRHLWNPKVHYRIHNSLPLVLSLSRINSVHTFPLYFPRIHSVIFFPSTPRFSKWPLPFRFQTKILYKFLISTLHSTCSTHLILQELITLIISVEAYKLWSSLLCCLLHSPDASSLLCPNISLSTLFPLTMSVRPVVWETEFHTGQSAPSSGNVWNVLFLRPLCAWRKGSFFRSFVTFMMRYEHTRNTLCAVEQNVWRQWLWLYLNLL